MAPITHLYACAPFMLYADLASPYLCPQRLILSVSWGH